MFAQNAMDAIEQTPTHTLKCLKYIYLSIYWKLPVKKKQWNPEALANLQAYSMENYRPRNFPKDSLFCYSVVVHEKFTPKSTK